MKKALAILLVAILCLTATACGSQTVTVTTNEPELGHKQIPESEITNYLTVHELTLDNWTEFYEIKETTSVDGHIYYGTHELTTNSFPQDVVLTFQYTTHPTLYNTEDDSVRLDKEVQEKTVSVKKDAFSITSNYIAYIYQGFGVTYEKSIITDLACTAVSGKVVTCHIPDEYWYTDDQGRKCFNICYDDNSFKTLSEKELEWLEEYVQ